MKKSFYIIILVFSFLCLSVTVSKGYYSNTGYEPVLMKRAALEKSIAADSPRSLQNPMKIYFKDNYIFISEKYKGIHVIDNSDKTAPKNITFITVPGCIDMAVKNNTLYADNAVDLVAIDISNISNVKEVSRIKHVFPELTPPGNFSVPAKYQVGNRPENTIIVEWIKN